LKWHLALYSHLPSVEALHRELRSALQVAEVSDIAERSRRAEHRDLRDGLFDPEHQRGFGTHRRVLDQQRLAILQKHAVLHRGVCEEAARLVLIVQSLFEDLHVQDAEKSASKTVAERSRAFARNAYRRIRQLQFEDVLFEQAVLGRVLRVHAGEHHRLGLSEARLSHDFTALLIEGVADARVAQRLHVGEEVAYVPRADIRQCLQFGVEDSGLV